MQKLKLKTSSYETKLLFFRELINTFTQKLNIQKSGFYSKINSSFQQEPLLTPLSYKEDGLQGFDRVLENYKEATKRRESIYSIAPFLSSLARALKKIYTEAPRLLEE